jgi:HD-GYP domain-containing protein (c-di-GMP phosphodiesterase class II)
VLASLREALPIVLFHHERWDGAGYPTGRRGDRIPLEARLLALADSFDAMTSDRPYRPARSVDDALDEVERCAGSQFDPRLAEFFVEAWAAGELPHSADQTSSFDRTRRITSSVNSVVPACPPRSAVRTPSATASRHASRIARAAS